MTLVLIVEDNPINRDVLGRRLERRGYNVRFAEDGPGGIAATKALKPDVVLMDIGLGEMDGWEATRRIKADPEIAPIPIIALTASAFESDRIKSLAAGCCDFDTKPVDLPRLLGKIENSLRVQARP
jgi:two-component system, cell cycle response regulator DivK